MTFAQTKRHFIEFVLENGDTIEVSLVRKNVDLQVYKRTIKGDSELVFDAQFNKRETKELIEILQELIND